MQRVHKSATGHHNLITSRPTRDHPMIPTSDQAKRFTSGVWTFGRGAVIWRIWPAVCLHTLFAAVIVTVSLQKWVDLAIPPVMMTILGVVIGFVIAYRASSGYDRFWMGRSVWGDVIRNCRTAGRLVWYHVPPRLTPDRNNVTQSDIDRVIREKKVALDLIEGFAYALKHHLRGEIGFYDDTYPLIRALETNPNHHHPDPILSPTEYGSPIGSPQLNLIAPSSAQMYPTPLPYGTFEDLNTAHGNGVANGDTQPLLPSNHPPASHPSVFMDLVPFASIFHKVTNFFQGLFKPSKTVSETDGRSSMKSKRSRRERPRIAGGGGGQNLPLEIVRALSEWVAVLEERGATGGAITGNLLGCLANFEDCVTVSEKILTTPLPFVYSVHIRHTIWMYLFCLPFQLTEQFGYMSIPGVGLAAFFFLGFLAAGEEIEEPFGNDANDLELDLFCNDVIHAEMCELAKTSCPNSYLALPSNVADSPFASGGSVVDHVKRELMDVTSPAAAAMGMSPMPGSTPRPVVNVVG